MKWEEPKVVIDIARGLLAVLLGIAAFSMAISHANELAQFKNYLYLLAVFCIILTARLCDWMLDRVTCESWAKALGRTDIEAFSCEFKKMDGFAFHSSMYANTYLIFTLLISGIAVVGSIELIGLLQTTQNQSIFGFVKFLSGLTLFAYISYQMLTIESKYATSIFFSIIFVLLSLLGYLHFTA